MNILLLFTVAIEPYLFYVLEAAQPSLNGFDSSAYALDVGAMMLTLAGLVYLFMGEEKRNAEKLVSPERLKRFRRR